jgi:hypothetical protein
MTNPPKRKRKLSRSIINEKYLCKKNEREVLSMSKLF